MKRRMYSGGFAIALAAVLVCACEGPAAPRARATGLAFTVQPSLVDGAAAFEPPMQVEVLDQFGEVDATATTAVTVTLGPGALEATLAGTTTVNAVAGIATFTDLRIDLPRTGYTLVATAPGLESATSAAFDVRLRFVQIDVGGAHTCGRTVPGTVFCWGDNSQGQLGDGTVQRRVIPTPVAGRQVFRHVSTDGHNCATTAGGQAYCWGYNLGGALGDGTMADRHTPTAVTGGLSFAHVIVGGNHTCGLTAAGEAYCWGVNRMGELGDGTGDLRLTPTPVAGGLRFSAMSLGGPQTCALDLEKRAHCWGANTTGQLGDGTTSPRSTPALVIGGLSFADLSVNPGHDTEAHTCGITTAHAVYCWGTAFRVRLTDGTYGYSTPTPVAAGLSFAMISAGRGHNCAVTTDQVVYCWGANSDGQLGDGTSLWRTVPAPIASGLRFVQVSAGYAHTCGVTAEHVAHCWGANASGQLGDGTTTARFAPVRVVQ